MTRKKPPNRQPVPPPTKKPSRPPEIILPPDVSLPGLDVSPSGLTVSHRTVERHYSGPTPDPQTLRELNEIYPDAARTIFQNYELQTKHRAELEKMAFASAIKIRARGQIIAGMLGGAGIIGSLITIGLGGGWAAASVANICVLSLASVFLLGRQEKKQESKAKDKIQKQIKRGEPIEEEEEAGCS